MPKVPKGQLSLGEIRNLVRQHNKASVISGVDTKSRSALIKELSDMGYKIDHPNKRIVKGKMEITTSSSGEQKPQKRTRRKQLISGGEAPVLAKKYPPIPPNVGGKKIKPDRKKIITEGDQPVLAKTPKKSPEEIGKKLRLQRMKTFGKLTLTQQKAKLKSISDSARADTVLGKLEISVLKELIAKDSNDNSTGQKNLQELFKLGDLSSKISGEVNKIKDKALNDAIVGMKLSQILDIVTIYEGSVGKKWQREGQRDPVKWVRLLQKEKVPLEMVKLAKLPLRSLVAGLKKSVDARGQQLKEGAVDFKDRNDVLETIGEEFEKHGTGSVSKYFNFPGDTPKKWKASKEQQASIKSAWSKYWEENFPGQISGSGDYRYITTKIIHKYFKKEDTTTKDAFRKIYQDVAFHGLNF